jgi:chromosome segregation ATPase
MRKNLTKSIVVVILMFSAIVVNAQTPDAGTQKLYQEYMTLNQELMAVQQKAYQDPAIAKQAEELSDMIDQKMIEIDPQAKELIQERDSIEKEFQVAQSEGDQEKIEKLQQDYQEPSTKLQPLNQQVMQIKEVQEKQQKLDSDIMQKMQDIEPQTKDKIERMNELNQQLQQAQPIE